MSVPESIAWLETSKNSKSPSMAKVYATAILGELERLSTALDVAVRECEKQDRLRQEAVSTHRSLESTLEGLEERTRAAREEWDATRQDLEQRAVTLGEKLGVAETMLKDTHYALTKQPELTREDIANAITSVIRPYAEGEKP